MKFTESMKEYKPLIPPIDKPFIDMSKAEAQAYFDWYISHVDERAEYLKTKVAEKLQIPLNKLDYSLESLKLIWKWFLGVAEISRISKKEIQHLKKSLKDYPQSFIDSMIGDSHEGLSIFTQFVLRDIGMYVGKVFTTNYPSIKWTFKTTPKNYISVNEPLLVGFVDSNPSYPKPFYPDLEPIGFAEGCAVKLISKTEHENDLYDICNKWIQWIPK